MNKPAPFREYWNILDARGYRLSDEAVSGPGLFDINARVLVQADEKWNFPLIEKIPDNRPGLDWHVKFGSLRKDDILNTETKALRLFTPEKDYDVAWLGNSTWRDYRVEAMIYCEFRPEKKPEGWERIGLFARDNGDHAPGVNNYQEEGAMYCMTYDSDDGRLRAGSMLNGIIGDFHPEPYIYIKESGWHRFSIRCSGKNIVYEFDGKPFHEEKSKLRMKGSCGVFYLSTFDKKDLSHGIRFYDFTVNAD